MCEKNICKNLSIQTRQHPILVSMTTICSRLPTVHLTIRSILDQTMPADSVTLWLSESPYLQDKGVKPEGLPAELLALEGLEIKWTENIGPYRKLVPILANEVDGNLLIITADDDVVYPKDWIEKLYAEYVEHPGCVICYRGRKIKRKISGKLAPYAQWEKTNPSDSKRLVGPSADIFPTGKDGILYPRNVFTDEVLKSNIFIKLAPTGDDIWFKAMTMLTKTKVKNIARHQDFPEIEAAQTVRLFEINHRDNDIMIDKVFRKYNVA